jgi:hypothetical protein
VIWYFSFRLVFGIDFLQIHDWIYWWTCQTSNRSWEKALYIQFIGGAFLLRMLPLSLLFVCMYLSSSTTTNYHPETNVIISERADCLLCWSPLQSCWDQSLPLLFLVNVRRAGTCMFRSNFINHKGWKYCSSD